MDNSNTFDRILVVNRHWGELILSGDKLWEMRTRKTNIRGRIAIAYSGSSTIFGLVTLVDSLEPISPCDFNLFYHLHKVPAGDEFSPERYRYPWLLSNPSIFESPIKYHHPPGAVTWVKRPSPIDPLLDTAPALL